MTAEALLWFPQARSSPALVSTNAAGVLPELDQGATVAFGGTDAFGDELAAGFRIDAGRMLSSDFGVGGRFWFLGEQEDTYNNEGTGATESIGVPFFDLDLANGQENSIKVAYDDATDGVADPFINADFSGNVSVRNTLDVYGAEGYGKLKLLSGRGFRTDFLGGFSHFGIDESLGLTLNATQTDNVNNQQFDVYQFIDNIEAENRFFGGQLGFLTSVNRGGWHLSALTKVHLGDMEQSLTGSGLRTRTTGAPLLVDNEAGGIYTTDMVGTVTENEFVFAPEANIKLSYQFRPHVAFSVGYSFIMWNDIVTVGDNMDRAVNSGALVNDGGGFDAVERQVRDTFNTRSFYVHGIDLGAVIKF